MAASSSSSFVAAGPNTIPTDRKRVIGELTRGREVADQLRLMLRDQTGASDATASVLPARGLVGKILDSFTRSISILGAGCDSDEVSQAPAVVGLKPEDSGESCKAPAAPKDRRGCYKRRRSTSETWIKESPTLFEDGHAWRKYGQKMILNAKHPRNYFRCTHKFDEGGCQASKQVQMIQDDDPPLYRITYHGQHSCKNIFKSNSSRQINIIDAATQDSSIIWSFGDAGHLVINKEEIPKSNRDYFLSSAFDTSTTADHGASTHTTMEMDHMMVPVASVFDDFLEFGSLT